MPDKPVETETVQKFMDQYLSEEEISEHLIAISQRQVTSPTLFACLAKTDTLELNQMEVDIGIGANIRFNDLGLMLAESGAMLFAIYLVNPKEKVLSYLTVDGRTVLATEEPITEENKEKYEKIEGKTGRLLTAFMEGFLASYCKKKEKPIEREKGSKLILPGDPRFKIKTRI